MKITKTRVAGVLVAGTLALTGGIAYSWWTTSGTGSGSATAGTDTPWDVTSETAVGAPLTPGGPTQSVAYDVANDSSGHQKLNQVVISVANANGSAWTSGSCDAGDFSLDGEAAGAPSTHTYGTDLAPGTSTGLTVAVQMVNNNEDQNDCRNVIVPLYFAAS